MQTAAEEVNSSVLDTDCGSLLLTYFTAWNNDVSTAVAVLRMHRGPSGYSLPWTSKFSDILHSTVSDLLIELAHDQWRI